MFNRTNVGDVFVFRDHMENIMEANNVSETQPFSAPCGLLISLLKLTYWDPDVIDQFEASFRKHLSEEREYKETIIEALVKAQQVESIDPFAKPTVSELLNELIA